MYKTLIMIGDSNTFSEYLTIGLVSAQFLMVKCSERIK